MAWGRRISLIGHAVLDGLGGGRERAEAEAEAEAEERRLVCDMGWNTPSAVGADAMGGILLSISLVAWSEENAFGEC